MSEEFALTGLMSRGGLSNWVLFSFPNELVMVDVGAMPAITAGVMAGALSQFGVVGHAVATSLNYGPPVNPTHELQNWCAELRTKAKNVVELKSDQVLNITLRMKMTSHELRVTGADRIERKFSLMNREQANAAIEPLTRSFDARFTVSKTPTFAFFERHAPFLL